MASSTVFILQVWSKSLLLHLEMESDQPDVWLVGHFNLYITDNMLTYLAIWFAASYSSLLDIFLSLLSCRVSSYCTHPLHFALSPHPPRMFFSNVFTFSEKRVPLRDVLRPISLRFLMWIMITKGRLGFQPILS